MNVVLCGMMGAGKSTVGQKVASLLNRELVDTDTVITERYGAINDIFARDGEAHFRKLETEVTAQLSERDDLVISTGGGLVLKEENVELLKKNGKLFFLTACADTLFARVQGDDSRPLLKTANARERIEELLKVRTPRYESAADYVIDTEWKNADAVAREIVAIMERV